MKGPVIFLDIERRSKTWTFPQAAVKKWNGKKKKKSRSTHGSSLSPPRGSCLQDFSKAGTV